MNSLTKTILPIIPFLTASVLVLIDFFQILSTPASIDEAGLVSTQSVVDPIKYASIGLLITLVFLILQKNIWKYIFLILIILAFAGLIQFYHQTFSIGIGSIGIDITAFSLLIFHLAFNPDIIAQLKTDNISPKERNQQE